MLGGNPFAPQKAMTGPDAQELATDLLSVDRELFNELKLYMKVSEKILMYHFNHETMHSGIGVHELDPNFIKVVPSVDGLYDCLSGNAALHLSTAGGPDSKVPMPGLIYIYEKK